MRDLAKTFQAVSDTNRLRILKMLEIRPLCVCEITEILQLANSTVSKHLAILRDSGFILDEKDGKWVNYKLTDISNTDYVEKLKALIATCLPDDKIIHSDRDRVKQVDRNIICGI